MRAPLTGFVTYCPVKTPVLAVSAARSSVFFCAVARTYSSTSGVRIRSTSGCSGAITKNVAPYSVSGRVVKTGMSTSSSSIRKRISAPSLRPIQLRWIVIVRSGHEPPSGRSKLSSSSAYSVILKNHCSRLRSSTRVPQRSQWPSITYSLATTVWSNGHQFTGAALR